MSCLWANTSHLFRKLLITSISNCFFPKNSQTTCRYFLQVLLRISLGRCRGFGSAWNGTRVIESRGGCPFGWVRGGVTSARVRGPSGVRDWGCGCFPVGTENGSSGVAALSAGDNGPISKTDSLLRGKKLNHLLSSLNSSTAFLKVRPVYCLPREKRPNALRPCKNTKRKTQKLAFLIYRSCHRFMANSSD